MVAPTLANLPFDVIDRLLIALPDFATLAAAIKTCKHIYDTFRNHPKSTMRAVALNISGPALPDAVDLVRWQTSMVQDRESAEVLERPTYEETMLLLENAAVVAHLGRLYSVVYKDPNACDDQLSCDESRKFSAALYRFWQMHIEFTSALDDEEDEYEQDDDDDEDPIPHLQDVMDGLTTLSDSELHALDAVTTFMHDADCWLGALRFRWLPINQSIPAPDNLANSLMDGDQPNWYPHGATIECAWAEKALATAFRARHISDEKRTAEGKKAIIVKPPPVQQTCVRCSQATGPTFSGRTFFQFFQDFFASGALCRKFEDCLARNGIETKSLNEHVRADDFDWTRFYDELCEVTTLDGDAPWDKDGMYCLLCLHDFPKSRLRLWWLAKKQELGLPMKENCWYGWSCRTQTHKDAHADRLNHLCEPSRGTAYHPPATH